MAAVGGGIDQPAVAAARRRAGCPPTGHRGAAPAVRRGPRTPPGASASASRSSAAIGPVGQRAGPRGRVEPAGAAAACRRTRPRTAHGSFGSPRLPVVRRSSRPKHAGVGLVQRRPAPGRGRPRSPARAAPTSIHSRTRNGGAVASPSDTASTLGHPHGTRRGQPPQPGGLRGEEPWRRVRVRLGEHPSTVGELEAEGLGDVAASHHRTTTAPSLRAPLHGLAAGGPRSQARERRRADCTGPDERGRNIAVPTSIIWFRRDLRLSDHPALIEAVATARGDGGRSAAVLSG